MPEVDSKLEVVERVLSSELDLKAFRLHLDDVISGEAFRGSRRSAQFLLHIVEKTIHNETDALKERTIGTELFGRKADYDTGDDAIVRVTASEVRRRLLRHYGQAEDHSMYRINLLPGGYIPEIIRLKETNGNGSHGSETKWEFPPASIPPESSDAVASLQAEIGVATAGPVQKTVSRRWASRIILTLSMLFALLIGFFLYPVLIHRAVPFPWQPFISVSNPLQIITSDPNIAEIRGLTNHPISVSDYANRRFGCEILSHELRYVCETLLQGDKAAAVDAQAVAKIAALVERYKGKFNVQVARSIRMSDLRTDDSYIFLGSSRSNPWVDLFGDQMDFRIVYDPVTAQDVVVNRSPRQGELPAYKPTAKGFGTGQSYAVIAFLRNPDQQGRVLSLSGASAEGTLAAVNLVVSDDFSASLRSACDIKTFPAYFEELVRVDTMAGASTETQVISCHVHPPAKSSAAYGL